MIAPRKQLLPALSFALLVALTACAKEVEPEAAPTEEAATPEVTASTELATTGVFHDVVQAMGTVTPRGGTTASVSAPVAARIAAVLVVPGQSVKAGDVLVEIDRVAVEAEVARAEAVVKSAELAQVRADRLAQQGIIPRRELELANADLAQARAALTTSHRVMDLSTLRAPITGIVTRVNATVGGTSDPGMPLIEMANPGQLDLLFTVSPEAASRLRMGSSVTLFSSEGSSDTLGTAVVVQIAGMMDSLSRGVTVRAQGGHLTRPLRIGETVVGDLLVATIAKAILVPVGALVPAEEGFQLFVVDSSDTAHARPVTVGGRTATTAYITSGLSTGERVVTHGAFGMDDGAKVVTHSPGTP